MKRINAIVSGRVQGVGFRWFVKRTADSMGIAGWVKNLYNGNVELEAEGTKKDLDKFLEDIKLVRFGHVERLDVCDKKPLNQSDFIITG